MSQSDGLAYLRGQGETVKTSGGVIMILSDWKESSEHVDRNNRLLERAAEVYGKISGFEADCANAINAQRDSRVAEVVPVEAWMLNQDGDNTADLPWGHRSEENRNCGENIWHGVGTGAKELVDGSLTLLLGYNPQSGGLLDQNAWGPSWVQLGTGLGGLILSTSVVAQVAGLSPGPFQTVMQKSNDTSLGMVKGLVAWDEWSKNPGEAFGQTLFNAATILVPGPKGLGVLLKGTAIGGKVEDVISIATKATDDVISGTGDLFKKPKFDVPHVDLPDLDRPGVHLDGSGDGTHVGGHPDGGSVESPPLDRPLGDRLAHDDGSSSRPGGAAEGASNQDRAPGTDPGPDSPQSSPGHGSAHDQNHVPDHDDGTAPQGEHPSTPHDASSSPGREPSETDAGGGHGPDGAHASGGDSSHPAWSYEDSAVQDFQNSLEDAAARYSAPGYDPTGGLGWEGFLDKYFNGFDSDGFPEWVWPEDPPHAHGFTDGVSGRTDLKAHDVIERITFVDKFGDPVDGEFAAPPGTSFEQLSLPPDRLGDHTVTVQYEILKTLPDAVRMGDIAPGFGQPGHGTQYYFPGKMKVFLRAGYLRIIS